MLQGCLGPSFQPPPSPLMQADCPWEPPGTLEVPKAGEPPLPLPTPLSATVAFSIVLGAEEAPVLFPHSAPKLCYTRVRIIWGWGEWQQ